MNLVELVREAVETYIKEGRIISSLQDLPEDFLSRRAGTFVTIEKNSELRGCIGTYLPTRKNIAEEIIHNAIAAATEDYRFGPIQKEELPELSYTVYILGEPEEIFRGSTSLNDGNIRNLNLLLNPKKYGVIVKTMSVSSKGDVVFDGHLPYKSGLLLPDLDGVETVEQQIKIAANKARINLSREKILIYRFMVEKFVEK